MLRMWRKKFFEVDLDSGRKKLSSWTLLDGQWRQNPQV